MEHTCNFIRWEVKGSDCHLITLTTSDGKNVGYHGYAPDIIGISEGDEDYLEISVCMECGHLKYFESTTPDRVVELLKEKAGNGSGELVIDGEEWVEDEVEDE